MHESARHATRLLRSTPPFLLTAANAAAGVAALALLVACIAGHGMTLVERIDEILLLLGLAMLCDAADGPAARALAVESKLGQRCDAAADAVSFGAVPALLIIAVASQSDAAVWVRALTASAAVGYAASAWVRLWRFQSHEQQQEDHGFFGLPTPAATLLVASCVMWMTRGVEPGQAFPSSAVAASGSVALAAGVLMLGPWRYPHPARWLATRPSTLPRWLALAALWIAWAAFQPSVAAIAAVIAYAGVGPLRWLFDRVVADPLRGVKHGSA